MIGEGHEPTSEMDPLRGHRLGQRGDQVGSVQVVMGVAVDSLQCFA
jgi:hypothetical protein